MRVQNRFQADAPPTVIANTTARELRLVGDGVAAPEVSVPAPLAELQRQLASMRRQQLDMQTAMERVSPQCLV